VAGFSDKVKVDIEITADGKKAEHELEKVEQAAKSLDGSHASVGVDADDNATAVLDENKDKVEDLDGTTATVGTEADDQATATLDEVQGNVEGLDGETATVDAEADDAASAVLTEVEDSVASLDGTTATVEAEADDSATDVLDGVRDVADALDQLAPEIVPEVDDSAIDVLEDIKDTAEELDGMSPEITPTADTSGLDNLATSAAGAKEHTDQLGASVGFLAGKFGGDAGGLVGTATPAAAVIGLVGGAAVIAAQNFGELALKAQAFATAAGTDTETASRWIELTGDLGVNADMAEGAIGRMNKNLGSGKIDLANFGLVAGTTSENFINLLRYIGGIDDAAKQAAVGAEVFGRGWQGLAPLIVNVDTLGERLTKVADIKVMNPENIAKAEELRDKMDELTDSFNEAALELGDDLIPALIAAADGMVSLARGTGIANNQIKDSPGFWDSVKNALGLFTGGTYMAEEAQKKQAAATKEQNAQAELLLARLKETNYGNEYAAKSAAEYAAKQGEAAKAAEAEKTAIEETGKALDALNQLRDDTLALLQRQQDAMLASIDSEVGYNRAVDDVDDALLKFQTTQGDSTATSKDLEGASRGLEDALSKAAAQAVIYAGDQATAAGATFGTEEKIAAQRAALELLKQKFPELAPAIDAHIAKLDAIPKAKNTDVDVQTAEAAIKLQGIIDKMAQIKDKTVHVNAVGGVNVHGTEDTGAMGGFKSGWVLVGEEGEEIVELPDGSYVHTAAETRQMKLEGKFAGGGLVGGAPATREGQQPYPGMLLSDLFGPGSNIYDKASQSDDPLRKLFGVGTDFATYMITGGQYVGQTLGGIFGPGSDFYRTGFGVLDSMFGRGSDFAGITVTPPGAQYVVGDTGPFAGMPPTPPKSMVGGLVIDAAAQLQQLFGPGGLYQVPSDFGYFADASGVHAPTGPGGTPYNPATAKPSAPSVAAPSSTFAAENKGASRQSGGNTYITIHMPPGSDGQDVVQALKRYERRNGVVPVHTL
jgi:hypothetical protein